MTTMSRTATSLAVAEPQHPHGRAALGTIEIVSPGMGITLQDRGRFGWRRFGIPIGGVMDDHAAECANRLLDNPLDAPVLELQLQGAKLRVLKDVWLALS